MLFKTYSSVLDRLQLLMTHGAKYVDTMLSDAQRAKTCPGYCNVNTEHMISLQRSLTLRDSYLFDVLQLKCPTQEGSAHPLVACSIFRSSMGGREDFSAIFTVTFSSHWPGAHGKKLEKTNNEQWGSGMSNGASAACAITGCGLQGVGGSRQGSRNQRCPSGAHLGHLLRNSVLFKTQPISSCSLLNESISFTAVGCLKEMFDKFVKSDCLLSCQALFESMIPLSCHLNMKQQPVSLA